MHTLSVVLSIKLLQNLKLCRFQFEEKKTICQFTPKKIKQQIFGYKICRETNIHPRRQEKRIFL